MDYSTPRFPVLHYLTEVAHSCPLSRWCHPTIASSIGPILLLSSIFPRTRVFSNESALHIRWPKYWTSASTSALPMNIQGWFPLGFTGLISLQSKELSRVFSSTIVQKYQFFVIQPSLWSHSHIHTWLSEKLKLGLQGLLLAKRCLCFLICFQNLINNNLI